jgi:uncharacterized protein (DUF1778 family)
MASTGSRRKPSPRNRVARLEARISREQKRLFQRAADLQGRTLTDFVVSSAQEAAVRTIGEMQIIRLNGEDSRVFAETLLSPREPTERLRAAARRYREMIGG